MKATAVANSNLAFIKYFGKKDASLNLPLNTSVSMTLDQTISTQTTIEFSPKYNEDVFILNRAKQSNSKNLKVTTFLDVVRNLSHTSQKAKVVSINTFPTGTGIASSASGFAALAAASAKALNLRLTESELSGLARRGSGSASRSVISGFVEWSDEYAHQLYDENYWPEIRDIVVIVSEHEKSISSRDAMTYIIKSELFKKRLKTIQNRIENVKRAILKKDFNLLAHLIMEDSDELHSCLGEVGITYLDQKSTLIKEKIKSVNTHEIKAAYSFDAGPNPHIVTLDNNIDIIKEIVAGYPMLISKVGKGIKYSEQHLF